jgi:thiol:disulfide interchange protein
MNWAQDWKSASLQLITGKRPLFADLYNPECIACQTMDADTYSQRVATDFFHDSEILIPKPKPTQGGAPADCHGLPG